VLHLRRELRRADCQRRWSGQDQHSRPSLQLHFRPIAKALLDAHRRGVRVEVILDKSQRSEKYSSADFLANQGVPTMIDAEHAISHNKVMIIDKELVITGSFNFTKAAQKKNAENVLIIRDKALADRYSQNWQVHAQHSQPYVGRGVR
jgi:phosphatidylserine/phosphatidylglycerophosphate/cardiolipin synthase-like enzyme